ncbi:uncharacterized protein K02A2.6-like [Rhipicephalus sanguineus]|uniref:uncharacterized protein K02A2.6-like n=1 Tax=Rhipicephalus sanguineus TaxID=34632 RepID=UPI001893CA90|nr:uncharacterized protein K02A2.6-like [Rhipicephalus sanguineus]
MSAPEYFQRQMSYILEGQEGVVNMIDDILVFGRDRAEHDSRLQSVLARLRNAGLTLNKSKCQFGVTSVKFLGVAICGSGISPDPDKLAAVKSMEPPFDVGGVRRLLGMVKHVGRFLPHLSEVTAPIRGLLNKRSDCRALGLAQQVAFQKLKDMSSNICMANYHPPYPTIVSADSKQRYSQTEKEALAAAWAVKQFEEYVRGLHFTIETDHLPLTSLLCSMDVDALPPRIQRIRLKLMRYQYTVLYVPGKLLATADTLSRAPVTSASPAEGNQVELVQRAEPLLPTPSVEYPWHQVGVDLFHLEGQHFLLLVDYYSRYPEVITLRNTSSQAVISAIKSVMARFGIPEVLRSDNGPQFSSHEFSSFAQSYGFRHITSSAGYPQSNGAVERAVKTVKDLFRKSNDRFLALLAYRDTPGVTGYSPSQLLIGRRLRTRIPRDPAKLSPDLPRPDVVFQKDAAAKERQTRDFNRLHGARVLRDLSSGDLVWVTDAECRAQVLSRMPASPILHRGNSQRSYTTKPPASRALFPRSQCVIPSLPSELEPKPGAQTQPGRTITWPARHEYQRRP